MANIKAEIFNLPEKVEPAGITTAGHYILATHLMRPLTQINEFGSIEGDILKNWNVDSDKLNWKFELKTVQFSDGSQITSDDVVATIKRQIKLKSAVHFNFADIDKVSAVDKTQFIIKLNKPNSNFPYDLSKPEFGILPARYEDTKVGEIDYIVSSGPFTLSKKKNDKYYLKKNEFFRPESTSSGLTIASSKKRDSIEALKKGEIDFFVTQEGLTSEEHQALLKNLNVRATKPHVVFSYWLSINPNSAMFSSLSARRFLQNVIHEFRSKEFGNHTWEKANQLYLPGGDGRPSDKELESIWAKIKNTKEISKEKKVLRVVPLKTTNNVTNEVVDYLGKFYEVRIIPFKTEQELVEIIKGGNFDLKLSSNDFSSIDLFENLKTTFNSNRPYIFLPRDSDINRLMTRAGSEENSKERSMIFKQIGLDLLDSGLIAPVGFQRVWFYSRNEINTSKWSKLFPEISFWKVTKNAN